MAFADEISAMAMMRKPESAQDRWRRISRQYRRKVRAYRSIFMDEDDQLSDAAKLVLGDLAAMAGIGKARLGRTPEQMAFDEGQRRIVLHLIESMHLDPERLEKFARKIRETSDE